MTFDKGERYSPEQWYRRAVRKTPDWSPLEENTPSLDLSLPKGVTLCAIGVVLPVDLKFEEWADVGKTLVAMGTAVQWALGEWWAFGDHKYGDRAQIAKKFNCDFRYLMNLGWVARSVPTSSRNEALSFTHHVKVAKLSPGQQVDWLEEAAKRKWSAQTLEQKIKHKDKVDSTKENQRLEKEDPEGYRIAKSVKTAAGVVHHFGKMQNADLEYHTQAILNDEQFLADLDDRTLARMITAASSMSDVFNEVVNVLRSHQQARSQMKAAEADRKKNYLKREFLECEV